MECVGRVSSIRDPTNVDAVGLQSTSTESGNVEKGFVGIPRVFLGGSKDLFWTLPESTFSRLRVDLKRWNSSRA